MEGKKTVRSRRAKRTRVKASRNGRGDKTKKPKKENQAKKMARNKGVAQSRRREPSTGKFEAQRNAKDPTRGEMRRTPIKEGTMGIAGRGNAKNKVVHRCHGPRERCVGGKKSLESPSSGWGGEVGDRSIGFRLVKIFVVLSKLTNAGD